MPPRAPRAMKGSVAHQKAKKGTLKRLLSMLIKNNKKLLFVVICCLVVSAITGVSSSFFLTWLINTIQDGLRLMNPIDPSATAYTSSQAWQAILPTLITIFVTMGVIYLISVLSIFISNRLMAIVTQRFLHQTRTAILFLPFVK